jgi:AcrR family transcriptional regulator
LKFSDVFEAAGVSRGSSYRIYNGIDDLLQDLASEWVNNFVEYLTSSAPREAPASWAQLSDFIVRRSADYWTETSDTMRVLPRIRSSTPSSYNSAVHAMSNCMSELFNRYFVIPVDPGWHAKMSFYTQICDIAFADAVRADGLIGEQRVVEAATLCRTYLAFHLPPRLPPRDRADN